MTATPWEIRPWRIVTLLELLEGYVATIWATSGTLGQALIRLETDAVVHPTTPGRIGQAIAQLRELATHLKLRPVIRECQHFGEFLNGHDGPINHQRLRELILHLMQVMGGALEDMTFLALPPEFVDLYRDPPGAFGNKAVDAFPLATEDISEAGKCLALGRSTATVFHLMRAMECLVRHLSAKLGISNTEREWGKLLSDMTGKIETMPLGSERNRWSENRTYLYHVKQAWRNDTMHPKQTYTQDEATKIFNAVKDYMTDLADFV